MLDNLTGKVEAGSGTDGGKKILKAVIWLAFFAAIFSQLVHYVFLDFVFGGDTALGPQWRVLGMTPAFVGLALFFLISRFDQPSISRRWRSVTVLSVFTAFTGLSMGLWQGYTARYMVADLYRYSLTWISLFVFLSVMYGLQKTERVRLLIRVLELWAVWAVADAIVTFYLANKYPYARISTSASFIGIAWALFQDRRPTYISAPVLAICAVGFLSTGKRGNFVALIILLPLCVIVWFRRPALLKQGLTTVMIMLLSVGAMYFWVGGKNFSSKEMSFMSERILSMQSDVTGISRGETKDSSWEGRKGELRNIIAYFDTKPHHILFGAGFGAEIEPQYHTGVVSRSGKMHHVHIAWFAYYLRNGFIGVALLALFWLQCTVELFSARADRYLNWRLFAAMMLLFSFIGSLKGNTLLEDIGTPFFAAMLVGFTLSEHEKGGEG